jgi:hypothetical protein
MEVEKLIYIISLRCYARGVVAILEERYNEILSDVR